MKYIIYDFNEKSLQYYVNIESSNKDFLDILKKDFKYNRQKQPWVELHLEQSWVELHLVIDNYEKEYWYTNKYKPDDDEKIVIGYIPRRLGFFEKLKFWK